MIDNQYVHELDIDLDMKYLTDLVKRLQYTRVIGLAGHQRLVSSDPYMSSIRAQIPILADIFNIYTLRPGIGIPMHIDAGRQCALNIPIFGTKGTDTIFYKFVNSSESILENVPDKIYNIVQSPVSEVYRHSLCRPLLINNTIPHEVTAAIDIDRVTISWSFSGNITHDQAKDAFGKYSQNKKA